MVESIPNRLENVQKQLAEAWGCLGKRRNKA
jgi:hypothetical protein